MLKEQGHELRHLAGVVLRHRQRQGWERLSRSIEQMLGDVVVSQRRLHGYHCLRGLLRVGWFTPNVKRVVKRCVFLVQYIYGTDII